MARMWEELLTVAWSSGMPGLWRALGSEAGVSQGCCGEEDLGPEDLHVEDL